MKAINFLALGLILTACASSNASLEHNEIVSSQNVSAPAAMPMSTKLAWDGIYEVTEDMELTPKAITFRGKTMKNDVESFRLNKGESVALQFSGDSVEIGFAPTSDTTSPQKIVIPRAQFESLALKLQGRGTVADLKPEADFEKTQIAGRMVYKQKGKAKAWGCVAYVLRHTGTPWTGRIGGGQGMTSYLKRQGGWKDVSCNNAPAGVVGSWQGKHTAISNGKGGWCYDLNCQMPGRGYGRLKSCVARVGGSGSWGVASSND